MEAFAIFAVFILIAIVSRLMKGGMDSDRVDKYIRDHGGELIDFQWSPFGRGWYGEKNDRIYEVRYRDRSGNVHEVTVKTSMFSGVYFTEDRIVQAAKSDKSQSRDIQFSDWQ